MVTLLPAAATRLRTGFAAACAALLLAACGGGDDGSPGPGLAPGRPALQGDWVLRVTVDGVTTAAIDVPAASVPGEDDAAALETGDVAALIGATLYQGGYAVTVNGSTVRVVDPDSNYFLTVDRVRVDDFEDCGACGVGTSVTFMVTIDFTESGTLDGVAIPPDTDTEVLSFDYERIR
jgi:hypothetical protein